MPRPSRPRSSPNSAYDVRTLLTHRILVLSNTLGNGAVRLYAGRHGVPLAEWRLLAALAGAGPSSVNVLAADLGTDKGWVSRTAAAVVAKGLATTRADESDGRRFEIALTPAGRALYERILPAALDRQRRLLSVLTEDERKNLDELLAKLQRQAERIAEAENEPDADVRRHASSAKSTTNPRSSKARKRIGKEMV